MKNENYEMVKKIILNEQRGRPEKLKLLVVENSLSDKDKERIKQVVLDNATRNMNYEPSRLAKELCLAFTLIQTYTNSKHE